MKVIVAVIHPDAMGVQAAVDEPGARGHEPAHAAFVAAVGGERA